jgi:ABC-type Zn uptake system ZnuABC Zn-binding protein ZnuA
MKYIGYLYLFIFIIVGLVVLSVAKKLGLLTPRNPVLIAEEKKQLEIITTMNQKIQDLKSSKWFDPDYHKEKYDPSTFLNYNVAREAAKGIDDSFGILNDDEERIYKIFRAIPQKRHISQVASYYDGDLLGSLVSNLNDSELRIIADIINMKND